MWVRDGGEALLLTWGGSDWGDGVALDEEHYRFGGVSVGGVAQLVTDLYLPFAMLGITNPAASPLDLIALASEEDALHLWATLPNTNPVNSSRSVSSLAGTAAAETLVFDLTQRYHWDQVGSGLCPNGSTGPRQFATATPTCNCN